MKSILTSIYTSFLLTKQQILLNFNVNRFTRDGLILVLFTFLQPVKTARQIHKF